MGIGGEEIHMLHRGRKRAKRLDGVETKQNIALAQQPPNGVVVNAVTGNKMARGQRNKAGFGRELLDHQLRCDFPECRRG